MSDVAGLPKVLIDEETRAQLQELFAVLAKDVELHSFVKAPSGGNGKSAPAEEEAAERLFSLFTTRLCSEIAAVSPRLAHMEHRVANAASPEAARHGVALFPSVLVRAGGSSLPVFRMTGAPLGEEARGLVQSIVMLGTGQSGMAAASVKKLAELKEKRHVRVFSSPGCPYCPGQALNALKAAMERPDLVSAECVTSDQFPDLALRYQVGSVPHTRFGEDHFVVGLMSEPAFVHELVHLSPLPEPEAGEGAEAPADVENPDLVILGGGPAGLSAAIYAARSGMKAVVLEKAAFGGQVVLTPVVENYPGFRSVPGGRLGEILAAHARQYVPLVQTQVRGIAREEGGFAVHTPERVYHAKTLLFATGADWKDLGVPGEDRLRGKGVVHCASCDGYLFRNKKAVVVGGGNTALTDALHLKNLGVDITVMHRRDAFRAEAALQKALEREGIPVIWNSVAVEVTGSARVEGLRVKNVATGEERTLEVEGVFVAVGQKPHSELAAALGVEIDAQGAIRIDEGMRTNVPGIYAAGDVCGGARQIVTAVGEGAKAALAVFDDMQKKG